MPQINAEFAENPEPRCACLLLLDTSSSMSPTTGPKPIDALNAGLRAFEKDIQADAIAKMRVEIAIVTFGHEGVQKRQDFITADVFKAPTLQAGGLTPMGAAIQLGLDMIHDRKKQYADFGIVYFRPWILLITDGEPTDGWQEAASRTQAELLDNRFEFYAVAVAGANTENLTRITPRVLSLDGLKFADLFVWLSSSLKPTSKSAPGTQIPTEKITFGSPVTS
jgi:uncharacterized protein YegL